MKFISLFILITASFCLFTNCKIGDDENQVVRDVYSFQEFFTLSNVKQDYVVGDVIFMEYSFAPDRIMTDVTTGTEVTVGNPTMYTNLTLFNPFAEPDNLIKFGGVFLEGNFEDDNNFNITGLLRIEFGCPHDVNPRFKLGIDLKATGGYLLYPNPDEPFIQFAFTTDENCDLIEPPSVPDEADFGFVEFFFTDDTNLDQFNEYASQFPGTEVDLVKARSLLEEKRAFFIWVK